MATIDPTPTLETVTQPGTTSFRTPPDLKARLKNSYDVIAPFYNQWTLSHRAQRMDYATKLIHFLQRDNRQTGQNGDSADNTDETELEHPPHQHGDSADDTDETETEHPPHQHGSPIPSLRHMHALEVGCGSGVPVLEILLAKEMDVIGVDLSATQLALANAHFPNQTSGLQAVWAEEDMMDLRYPPDEFDVVVGLYSLIHLPREEQTVFLHRVFRWLKPGGMLLMNFPVEEVEGAITQHWLGHQQGWMFWSGWGEEKTMQIIDELGPGGMEVLLREVTEHGSTGDKIMWIIAKKRRV
ncbi:S-adenosyl-L-methionine-dependent methyltransferase [Chaetomidium leptoderma]|uniref:S-adenosyl-L-methionine-dependent methyltransferase n=1 Tax=Chaetomidium leptoderma TaxID=669021 RepID=A0AAN6ZWM9_9PEZI|nr:S-adenosyl-L-methionine-dependent methyltransferase [Chaetomidium leptoderma]